MPDANRSGMHELVEANLDLKIQYYKIRISEQEGQIRNLKSTIEKMKSVDIKRTELQLEVSKREMAQMQKDLKELIMQYEAVDVKLK